MRKKLIQDTSRRLYNERGLGNVTVRQTAVELKISSGNLTYHFKHRADVVEAIFDELEMLEEKFLTLYSQTTLNEVQLKKLMKAHAKAMFDYRFFWIDYVQIGRESTKTQQSLDDLMNRRLNELDFEWANYLNQFIYIMATQGLKFTPKSLEKHFKGIEEKVFVL